MGRDIYRVPFAVTHYAVRLSADFAIPVAAGIASNHGVSSRILGELT